MDFISGHVSQLGSAITTPSGVGANVKVCVCVYVGRIFNWICFKYDLLAGLRAIYCWGKLFYCSTLNYTISISYYSKTSLKLLLQTFRHSPMAFRMTTAEPKSWVQKLSPRWCIEKAVRSVFTFERDLANHLLWVQKFDQPSLFWHKHTHTQTPTPATTQCVSMMWMANSFGRWVVGVCHYQKNWGIKLNCLILG